jgi:hypothetical protein
MKEIKYHFLFKTFFLFNKFFSGLVVKDRPSGGISEPKQPFAHEHQPLEDLLEIIR